MMDHVIGGKFKLGRKIWGVGVIWKIQTWVLMYKLERKWLSTWMRSLSTSRFASSSRCFTTDFCFICFHLTHRLIVVSTVGYKRCLHLVALLKWITKVILHGFLLITVSCCLSSKKSSLTQHHCGQGW
ncbi:uncharacterized protein [Cicer arietinum]|uniref:uncharacterized protein n=1 Tax=Cicer arietinum TaxID=3827 RepID=UPI003CC69A6E